MALAILTANFKELTILFSIVFIHEMGHVVAAHFFSWRIKKIQLLPFGGVAEMDEHGNKPFKEELIVILAGPFQHIWLIALSYIFASFSPTYDTWFHEPFVFQNLVILMFNLLPIWPLDGGKLMFLLLSLKMPFYHAHRNGLLLSGVSLGCMIIFTLLYSPLHLNIWAIIGFLIFTLVMEWKQRQYVVLRFLLERYYGKDVSFKKLKPIMVNETEKVYQVLLKFQRGYKHPIIIQKQNKENFSLDENEVLHAYFTEKRTHQTVGELGSIY